MGTKVRRGRAALSDRFGWDAKQAVNVYCGERKKAGLETSRDACGQLARHFMRMRSEGWTQGLALDAVRAFALTERPPVFFHEWVVQTFHRQGDEEHARSKAEALADDEFLLLLAQARAVDSARRGTP